MNRNIDVNGFAIELLYGVYRLSPEERASFYTDVVNEIPAMKPVFDVINRIIENAPESGN